MDPAADPVRDTGGAAGLHASVHFSVGFARHGRHLRSRSVQDCGFLPLRGPHAGPDTFVKVQPGLWASLEDPTHATLTRLMLLFLVNCAWSVRHEPDGS